MPEKTQQVGSSEWQCCWGFSHHSFLLSIVFSFCLCSWHLVAVRFCEINLRKHLCCRVCPADWAQCGFQSLCDWKHLLWPSLLTCFVAQPIGALQIIVKYSWVRKATLLQYLVSGFQWGIICAVKKCCSFLLFMCVFPVGGVSVISRGKCDSTCYCFSLLSYITTGLSNCMGTW